MSTTDVSYARPGLDTLLGELRKSTLAKAAPKEGAKARTRTSASTAAKLTETVAGRVRFRSEPPILVPVPEDQLEGVIADLAPVHERYLKTLPPDRIAMLARYSFRAVAHRVVGVGSVGTRALVILLESGDGEPLLLQAKQASASVLEPYLGASRYDNAGQRVVYGQQVMQSGGDPFLGWSSGR